MKFGFTFEKRNCITSGIAFAVMLGFCLYSGKTPLMAVIFGAVYFLLKGLSIELTPKLSFAGGSYEDHKPEMDFKYFVLRGGLSGTDFSYRASEDRLYDSAYFSDVAWRDQLLRVAVPPE